MVISIIVTYVSIHDTYVIIPYDSYVIWYTLRIPYVYPIVIILSSRNDIFFLNDKAHIGYMT